MINIVDGKGKSSDAIIQLLPNRDEGSFVEQNKTVDSISKQILNQGDNALLELTNKFDKTNFTIPEQMQVTEQEIKDAYKNADEAIIESLKKAANRIRFFHEKQKRNTWIDFSEKGMALGQMIRPLQRVGVYVPGGTAAYPSSVLMNVIPAVVAGVPEIIMATPPQKDGTVYKYTLIAAKEAGVTKIFKAGGAQSILAMAYGTELIPKVDKITGPGNIYVALAKKYAYGVVDIDMIAGPSEILIIADNTANPKYIAADMLSQAEHDPLASAVLVTTSKDIADKTIKEIDLEMKKLSRKDIINKSVNTYCSVILTDNIEIAIEVANGIAPEHLELCINDPYSMLSNVKNAGAIFIGNYAPEPLGDYFAGPNHVLPTNGTARFFSPLNIDDFVKKTSIISCTKKKLMDFSQDIMRLANLEGLDAHANSISVRFEDDE